MADMTDVSHLITAQREIIEYQRELLKNMSRAPSTASMQDPINGQLADHCQRLTLDALQETEETVLYRGKFLQASVFNAIAEADDEEPKAVEKGWYKSEMTDVQFRHHKHPKDKTHYTCPECNGYWVKTGSAPTTVGSMEIVSPALSVDMEESEVGAAPPAETAAAWEKVGPLPKGVLQEWQLRPMCIPVVCTHSRFECGMCHAKWFLDERITAVSM